MLQLGIMIKYEEMKYFPSISRPITHHPFWILDLDMFVSCLLPYSGLHLSTGLPESLLSPQQINFRKGNKLCLDGASYKETNINISRIGSR
jgi:hypothetical protein